MSWHSLRIFIAVCSKEYLQRLMMISHDLHHNVTTLTPNLYGWWWWLLSTFIHGKSPCLISGSVTNWAKKVGLVGFKKLLMCRIHIIDDLMKIQSREAVGLPMKCTKMDQNGQEWSEIAWQCRSFSNFSWVTNFIYFWIWWALERGLYSE